MAESLPDFGQLREEMVETQLKARGVRDTAVLNAMRTVPRELFVPPKVRAAAYRDRALPLLAEQTISQPFIVAKMIELLQLKPSDRVLEIGAGSGYAAAVMSQIVAHVYSVERLPQLATYARHHLEKGGFDNVTVFDADGTLGLPDHAPYDAIAVAASGPRIPTELPKQLAINGRLILPVGKEKKQRLILVTRKSQRRFSKKRLAPVRFVPLIGQDGWEGVRPQDGK
ncbi:MAG: protein-L-isoaspartate(D-aspartate) O-methyltransferase [Chloroflexota bacterium]